MMMEEIINRSRDAFEKVLKELNVEYRKTTFLDVSGMYKGIDSFVCLVKNRNFPDLYVSISFEDLMYYYDSEKARGKVEEMPFCWFERYLKNEIELSISVHLKRILGVIDD